MEGSRGAMDMDEVVFVMALGSLSWDTFVTPCRKVEFSRKGTTLSLSGSSLILMCVSLQLESCVSRRMPKPETSMGRCCHPQYHGKLFESHRN